MQIIKRSIRLFKSIITIGSFCIFAVYLSGCATIFIPAKQKVAIQTKNKDSKVYVDNEEVGEGKNITAKVKKDGVKQVVVQTPHHRDAHYVLVQEKRVIAYIPLLILDIPFLYPAMVDALNREKISGILK